MKKLLLFVIACTLGLFGTVSAQETLFYDDFEDASAFEANWNLFQGSTATGANWQRGDGSLCGGYGDSYAVYSASYTTTNVQCDNYIITKNAYLISETSEIQWYVTHSAYNYAASDGYYVTISEDGTNYVHVSDQLTCESGEHEQSFSLADYAGKTIYVGFHHTGWGGEFLKLDNIRLTGGASSEGGEGGEEPGETPEEPEQPEAEPISEFFFDFNDGSMTGLRVFKDSLSQAANWQVSADGDTYYSGHENTRAIYSCSWDNNFVWPYNYVVTVNPCTITATSELSWFMRPSDATYASDDKYQVVASTDGVDFNIVLWTGTAASATENTLPLAEYAGETLYLGFYHYTEGTPGDAIVLDNIKLTAGEGGEDPTPEPEQPELCTINFTLKDSYNDSWEQSYLLVSYGEVSEQLNCPSNQSPKTYTLEIPQGANVTVTYTRGATAYPSENSFVITYESGKEILNIAQGTLTATTSYEFVVDCSPAAPEKPVVVAETTGASTIELKITAIGADSYTIFQNSEVLATGLTAETYTVEGLTPNTDYCFTVKSVNEVGESEISEEACATTYKEGTAVVQIGSGTESSYQAPVYDYYPYSISQTIYTAEEIGYGTGIINSISFNQQSGGGNTRNIAVYLKNTDKADLIAGWETLTSDLCVYDGSFTFATSGWVTIELQESFLYEGGNLLVCVVDKTGAYSYVYEMFYLYPTGTVRCASGYASSAMIDPLNITSYKTPLYSSPQIEFVIEPAMADVEVEPKTIAFGEVQVGEYWSEKEATTVGVTVKSIATTITSITCDNDFFVLPTEIDYTANKIELEIAYNRNGSAGEQTGNLTITYGDGATKVVPMTATAYTPTTADVFELAQEITFTENAYTDTPVFANLKDDYNLPKEVNKGNTPDAVYSFELEKEMFVTVGVNGTNAVAAIYKEDFDGKEGPRANNSYKGNVPAPTAPTTFFYDFGTEDALNAFTLLDKDADGHNWELLSGGIASFSWKSGVNALTPENYIYTNELYAITPTSKLLYKVTGANYPDHYAVVISEDGETFDKVFEENTSSNGSFITKEVDLGAYADRIVHIGFLHYDCTNQYYVNIDDFQLTDGNITSSVEPLISAVPYPAGKYYLVVAAEDEFTVNVNVEKVPAAPAAPVVAATATESTVTLTWEAVEDATSYNIYSADTLVASVTELTYIVEGLTAETTYSFTVTAVNEIGESEASNVVEVTTSVPAPIAKDYRLESVEGWGVTEYIYDEEETNKVVAIDEDGLLTEVTFNEAGQLASAFAYAEDVDEEGNPVKEVVSGVEYTYDENGVWTSFTETLQSWFGGSYSSTTVLGYNEAGQLVSLVSDEEYVRELSYNEQGLLSQVVEGYVSLGGDEDEEYEEDDETIEPDGVAPLSETAIEYEGKVTFEYDEQGRLVKKEYYYFDAYETMEFYLDESEVYEYDENGNCVAKRAYLLVEDEEGNFVLNSFPYSVTEYFYDLTIENEDVYSFEYPHFAFMEYVEPSYTNILLKEYSFMSNYDEDLDEVVSHSYDVVVYNYNPEVLSAPLAPMNLTAEVLSATEVELAWAGFPDAETFTIYSADTVYAEGVEEPYYTVEDLEMGVEYTFSVVAVNSVDTSTHSNTVVVKIELPAAPANLVAEATSDTTIDLTWEAVEGIWSYNIYSVVESEGETAYDIVEEEVWGTEYTVKGLKAETEYSFVVKSVNNVGESLASNVATDTTFKAEEDEPVVPEPTVPVAPVLAAEATSDTTIVLTWNVVEGALSYNVYQGADSIANVTDTTFTVTGLTADTEYSFTVKAVNEVGESEASNVVTVKTLKGEGVAENAAAFNIYPNPASDRVVIETEATIEELTIYTITGVMVYSEVDFNDNTINVSDFANGVYVMKVRTDNGESFQRFIKK